MVVSGVFGFILYFKLVDVLVAILASLASKRSHVFWGGLIDTNNRTNTRTYSWMYFCMSKAKWPLVPRKGLKIKSDKSANVTTAALAGSWFDRRISEATIIDS